MTTTDKNKNFMKLLLHVAWLEGVCSQSIYQHDCSGSADPGRAELSVVFLPSLGEHLFSADIVSYIRTRTSWNPERE